MAFAYQGDSLYAELLDARDGCGQPRIFEHAGLVWKHIRGQEGPYFLSVAAAPELDSFGNPTDQRGYYSPDLSRSRGDFC